VVLGYQIGNGSVVPCLSEDEDLSQGERMRKRPMLGMGIVCGGALAFIAVMCAFVLAPVFSSIASWLFYILAAISAFASLWILVDAWTYE
jgi:hypothetical protein